ncbi:ribonucleases P/MRP protein subunit POP1-domain-containing protein [Xylariaceae sp. FL0594]|nr:ribonucleases P/MRP protein subunit POP1-domain-containing protein [Xylariaceae sp. FL0594]
MAPKPASRGKDGKSSAGRPPPANSEQSRKRRQGPEGNNAQQNPRAAKRSKMFESRSIATQRPHEALQNGELNVQAFVNSMAFEINALDESMRRSRTSGTSRAFQKVPFTLRRRTAAHDYKRVPKRLHRRAQREMAEDNTPTVNSRTRKPKTSKSRLRAETARRLGILAKRKRLQKDKNGVVSGSTVIVTRAPRPKIRRNELNALPVTAPRYRKRQLKKVWLPTHMWHAKRARMTLPSEPLWGFSIPLTPTQKNYRPTHRVQWEKGAMTWDMSYMSTIGLFGKESILKHVLVDIGLTQDSLWTEKGKRWRAGAVHWTGNLSRRVSTSHQCIAPATVIWCPVKTVETPEKDASSRQVFIRIHPASFLEAFNELLRIIKGYTPRPYIQDLRHEIGSIEITGPDSTEALLGVLKPYGVDSEEGPVSRFKSLLGLRDPASLPLGAMLALSIADPRLSYPPRKLQPPAATDQQTQLDLLESISAFRNDEGLQPYQLFDRDARFRASKLPSQQSLNRRRGKADPGAPLKPTDADPPIPIMLLASRNGTGTHIPGTWTILLPWKCVQPVWLSLMHYPLSTGGNPKFGGLDEIRQLAFERGQPWFPGDAPGTDAGNAWETREREVRRKKWASRPKGKRTQWESVALGAGRKGEVGVGWSCDFETLFAKTAPPAKEPDASNLADGDHPMSEAAATDKDKGEEKDTEKGVKGKQNEKGGTLIDKPAKPLTDITHIPKNVFISLCSAKDPGAIPANAVVTVGIKILGRGVVSTCARVYRLPDPNTSTTTPTSTSISIPNPIIPIASSAEVSATQPPRPPAQHGSHIHNNNSSSNINTQGSSAAAAAALSPATLYNQWLAQLPCAKKNKSAKNNFTGPTNANVKNTNPATTTPTDARRQALARQLVAPPNSIYDEQQQQQHPPCPDAHDLIGFVTTGSFNLRDGRGEAIASISARLAYEEMISSRLKADNNGKEKGKEKGKGKGSGNISDERLCVVRDAGLGVGWLGRWELI